MADSNKERDINNLLRERAQLEQKIKDLQAEGYSLTTSYVESLKEAIGIRSRISTDDTNLLDINKKINKEILGQKVNQNSIKDTQNQILRNTNLINKAKILENNLSKIANKSQVEAAANQLTRINKLQQQNEYLNEKLSEGNNLSQGRVEAINKIIERNKSNIAYRENELNLALNSLTNSEKQLLYTKLTKEELEKQNKEREKEKAYLEAREKSLGLTGKLTKALSDIPGLREIFGNPEYLNQVNSKIDQIYNKNKEFPGLWRTLGIQIGVAGKMLLKSFTDPLAILGLMIKGFLELDKTQAEYTRETGKQVDHLNTINTSLISSSDYIKQAIALTKQFGLTAEAVFTTQTIQEAAEMVTLMGMSAEEAGRLAIFSKISGKELKTVGENIVRQVSNFNKANNAAINQKAVLQDVAKVSNSIAMTFGGNPEKIAAAAIEARKLGLTLESVNATADSLLNFEQSISNEIAAELVSGQALNLEKARLYALNDDIASLTKEIGNNEGIIAAYTKGNRITRQMIAESIGMSKDDLAKMVYQQQLQNGLTSEQAAKAADVGLEDMKRLSLQESINKSIEKMGQALAGPLQALASIVELLAQSKLLWVFIGGIAIARTITGIASLVSAMKILRSVEIGSAIAKGWSAAMSSPASLLTGGALGLAAGAAITAAIMSSVKSAGDLYSPAKGKTMVSTKEGGLFSLSDNDNVIAFPNTIKRTSPSTDNAAKAIEKMHTSLTAAIENLNNRPIYTVAQIDGEIAARNISKHTTVSGTTTNVFARKIQ